MVDDPPNFFPGSTGLPPHADGAGNSVPSSDELLLLAEQILEFRLRRGAFLDQDLLGEPVWDMLLVLFVAAVRRRWLTTAAVVALAACPLTTGLRWMTTLSERGMIQRRSSDLDQSVTLVALQAHGYERMLALLSDAWRRVREPAAMGAGLSPMTSSQGPAANDIV